ncbi:MAG: hypothetical protein ACD_75C00076G0001, partial [uncultured bacterium]
MQLPKVFCSALLAAAAATGCTTQGMVEKDAAKRTSFGQPITEETLTAWNIDVRGPDGRGLPL